MTAMIVCVEFLHYWHFIVSTCRIPTKTYYSSGLGKHGSSSPLILQESETQTTLPHDDELVCQLEEDEAVERTEQGKDAECNEDDDDDLDIYTAGDHQEENGKQDSNFQGDEEKEATDENVRGGDLTILLNVK